MFDEIEDHYRRERILKKMMNRIFDLTDYAKLTGHSIPESSIIDFKFLMRQDWVSRFPDLSGIGNDRYLTIAWFDGDRGIEIELIGNQKLLYIFHNNLEYSRNFAPVIKRQYTSTTKEIYGCIKQVNYHDILEKNYVYRHTV